MKEQKTNSRIVGETIVNKAESRTQQVYPPELRNAIIDEIEHTFSRKTFGAFLLGTIVGAIIYFFIF